MNLGTATSILRLIDSCITHLKAQRPSRTSNESKAEEEEEGTAASFEPRKGTFGKCGVLSRPSFVVSVVTFPPDLPEGTCPPRLNLRILGRNENEGDEWGGGSLAMLDNDDRVLSHYHSMLEKCVL